ncbi:hypothetical protein MM221_00490 [Salipaludibacillus sp. LMS25]|jgi:hypothetical protein|uniref:hypothetical protein n=1 Tax=Salipaludibacillus sp. LMS25 TaxID=2924031 RepID=UPI0020D0F633|nr:hypothetical protein [Salipaludibacillus sp. LMS25]UTR15116.1 hypothetical protein MM221_00490 [Salipaludibacillus sp. LMS25]
MLDTKLIQNMISRVDSVNSKSVTLRPGQVFQGAITQLYPGQMAQLKLGGLHLSAQLEAQLEKGEKYWFRVLSGGGIPKLKVLEGVPGQRASDNGASSSQQALLQQLGIKGGTLEEKVLNHLNHLNLPFTKGNVSDGANVLRQSSLSQEQSLNLVTMMIQKGLPLTKDTFQAMGALQSQQSSSATMGQLMTTLQSMNDPHSQQLQHIIGQLLGRTAMTASPSNLTTLLRQLQSGDKALQQQAWQVARQLGIIPTGMNETSFYEQVKANILRGENDGNVRQLWPQGSQAIALQSLDPKSLFTQLIQGISGDTRDVTSQLLQVLNPKGQPQQVMSQLSEWLRGMPSDSLRELWTLMENSRPETFQFAGKTTGETLLKAVLQQLGLQHEADVKGAQQASDIQKVATLKSTLLQFLQQVQSMPQQVREQAEFLLQRLTGYQLMSSDQQGPIQHTLFQIPIKLTDTYQDMTIQWEGRQNSDGSIDDSHCRILFYLQLETIDETVVDVQIQNRVISLTVYNEIAKPSSVQQTWYPLLKEKLQSLDYQLSTINWKQPEKEILRGDHGMKERQFGGYTDENGYQGVDIRI